MANDINSLLSFIEDSPSPFHTVLTSTNKLTSAGFAELKLGDAWELQRGGKYFVNVYGSTLIAFTIGEAGPLRMAAAHTDFPCFRVKP
ncbi:MAG: M18 family aminopeptidase, partial [Selenomonadaceae bacterium]